MRTAVRKPSTYDCKLLHLEDVELDDFWFFGLVIIPSNYATLICSGPPGNLSPSVVKTLMEVKLSVECVAPRPA